MPRVRFQPSGVEVEVEVGTTLYRAAVRAGLAVATACREEGWCGRCGLRVRGELSPESADEVRVKVDQRVDPELRLSCVTEVRGDVEASADYW